MNRPLDELSGVNRPGVNRPGVSRPRIVWKILMIEIDKVSEKISNMGY